MKIEMKNLLINIDSKIWQFIIITIIMLIASNLKAEELLLKEFKVDGTPNSEKTQNYGSDDFQIILKYTDLSYTKITIAVELLSPPVSGFKNISILDQGIEKLITVDKLNYTIPTDLSKFTFQMTVNKQYAKLVNLQFIDDSNKTFTTRFFLNIIADPVVTNLSMQAIYKGKRANIVWDRLSFADNILEKSIDFVKKDEDSGSVIYTSIPNNELHYDTMITDSYSISLNGFILYNPQYISEEYKLSYYKKNDVKNRVITEFTMKELFEIIYENVALNWSNELRQPLDMEKDLIFSKPVKQSFFIKATFNQRFRNAPNAKSDVGTLKINNNNNLSNDPNKSTFEYFFNIKPTAAEGTHVIEFSENSSSWKYPFSIVKYYAPITSNTPNFIKILGKDLSLGESINGQEFDGKYKVEINFYNQNLNQGIQYYVVSGNLLDADNNVIELKESQIVIIGETESQKVDYKLVAKNGDKKVFEKWRRLNLQIKPVTERYPIKDIDPVNCTFSTSIYSRGNFIFNSMKGTPIVNLLGYSGAFLTGHEPENSLLNVGYGYIYNHINEDWEKSKWGYGLGLSLFNLNKVFDSLSTGGIGLQLLGRYDGIKDFPITVGVGWGPYWSNDSRIQWRWNFAAFINTNIATLF